MNKTCLRYVTCEDINYDLWAPEKNEGGNDRARGKWENLRKLALTIQTTSNLRKISLTVYQNHHMLAWDHKNSDSFTNNIVTKIYYQTMVFTCVSFKIFHCGLQESNMRKGITVIAAYLIFSKIRCLSTQLNHLKWRIKVRETLPTQKILNVSIRKIILL